MTLAIISGAFLQIEALRHGGGKIERLSHDQFTGRMREVKRDVVSKTLLSRKILTTAVEVNA